MSGEMSGSWLFVALIETCVGSAMAIYGWKQREPVALVFGIALSLLAGVVRDAGLSALVGLGLVVLFLLVKQVLR